jgi:hypothetical protein
LINAAATLSEVADTNNVMSVSSNIKRKRTTKGKKLPTYAVVFKHII